MPAEILGVKIDRFRDPIQQALKAYEEKSSGDFKFNTFTASDLSLTPEKSNSARSATDVKYRGENIGTLYVIAFKPQDGTGDEKTYRLQDIEVPEPYPKASKIVPRSKAGVYNEGHLTVVTHKIENLHAEPVLFDGSFDLLGLQEQKVLKIGTLGHLNGDMTHIEPKVTFTTGYTAKSERFADPHSVFSLLTDRIQVCAFLAISEIVNQKHSGVLESLKPQLPISEN